MALTCSWLLNTDLECKIPANRRHQSEEGTQVATVHSAGLPGKQLTVVPGITGATVVKHFGVEPW